MEVFVREELAEQNRYGESFIVLGLGLALLLFVVAFGPDLSAGTAGTLFFVALSYLTALSVIDIKRDQGKILSTVVPVCVSHKDCERFALLELIEEGVDRYAARFVYLIDSVAEAFRIGDVFGSEMRMNIPSGVAWWHEFSMDNKRTTREASMVMRVKSRVSSSLGLALRDMIAGGVYFPVSVEGRLITPIWPWSDDQKFTSALEKNVRLIGEEALGIKAGVTVDEIVVRRKNLVIANVHLARLWKLLAGTDPLLGLFRLEGGIASVSIKPVNLRKSEKERSEV